MGESHLGGMYGIGSGEGDIIILGSSDVVETTRIWRKHTKVSTLAAQLNCISTAILKLVDIRISKGLGS